MKTVIVGCGRVGSVLADAFDRAGHEVIVLDTEDAAPSTACPARSGATAVRGDGTDEDTLRRAGADGADVFMAMTEGDNRNVMAAQLATEALGARQVIAKINDPLRASAYAELGIATLCRTNLMATRSATSSALDLTFGPGLSPATGSASRRRAPRPGRRLRTAPAAPSPRAGRRGRRRPHGPRIEPGGRPAAPARLRPRRRPRPPPPGRADPCSSSSSAAARSATT